MWLILSGLITLAMVAVLVGWGLKPGIDFAGGSLLELRFTGERPTVEILQAALTRAGVPQSLIQRSENDQALVRTGFLSEIEHQQVLAEIKRTFDTRDNEVIEERFETIGAAVSRQLRQRALLAIIFVNAGIVAYVAYAFRRVSRPVASWKYGVLAIVALVHDVLLVMGIFAALGHFRGVEVDTGFVVALLTVLGYSVNDTIVVYDRIRENLLRHSAADFAGMVNAGLNETLMRSINTTLTTLLPLFALYFLGGPSIHNFALALLIGIASGAYSSIFIASPLLVLVERWQRRRLAA